MRTRSGELLPPFLIADSTDESPFTARVLEADVPGGWGGLDNTMNPFISCVSPPPLLSLLCFFLSLSAFRSTWLAVVPHIKACKPEKSFCLITAEMKADALLNCCISEQTDDVGGNPKDALNCLRAPTDCYV